MSYQHGVPANPLSSPPRSQTPSSQTSTISLSSTPSPYTRTQNALTQDLFGMQGSSSVPMDQHPQYLMSPPPQGRGHGSPYQQVVLINHVDQNQQQEVVAGRGKRATPKAKGGSGRKTPHATVQAPAGGDGMDSDEVQVVVDMGAPAGGRRANRPPPMDKEAKKERTRENEKERRQHQKNGMKRLRQLIPPQQPDDENGKKKTINDGMVVNMAADHIETLLKSLQESKKRYANAEGELKKWKHKINTVLIQRQLEIRKFSAIINQAKLELRHTDEAVAFGFRAAKKLELATAKLRYYHEFAVKNPDKIQPAEVDLRLFEVERERYPSKITERKEWLEAQFGDDTLKMMERNYAGERERARARREEMLAIEGPSELLMPDGNCQVVRQHRGRGQLLLPLSQEQQMQLALNKQHQQMQIAVSKQQQLLMGVQGNQQAGVRTQAQLTQTQVNQVTKIMPPGARLPNNGNVGNRPGQPGQVRFITLKQEPGVEPQFLRCQGPNRNDRHVQITGGNLIVTHSQNGQPLILRANDGTQLYSLANLQQEHQASVGGQGGRVLMEVVKPQMFQNGGGVHGQGLQARGPSVQGQGPRGPVIRPQQMQFRVVKRELFQDGGGGQGVQQQQGLVGRVIQQKQGPGGQTMQQQQCPAGQAVQQQQGPGGQAVQQKQGHESQASQKQHGPVGQTIQRQQGHGAQAIPKQQSQATQQGHVSQTIQQHQGPVVPAIPQQQQGPGILTIQHQGSVVEATQSQALKVPSTPSAPAMVSQQQGPEVQPTGLLAIKQEAVEDEEGVPLQPGGQICQAQQSQEVSQDLVVQGQQSQGYMDDSVEPVFGDYSFDALIAGLDSQTGPFDEGMGGGSDNSYDMGLVGLEARENGMFSRDSVPSTSRSIVNFTSDQGASSMMDGFDLSKVKEEVVDDEDDESMDVDTESVDVSGIKKERDEDETTDDEDGSEGEGDGTPPRKLPTWKIDWIGEEVESEQPERVDFTKCTVPIENMPGCKRRIGGEVKQGESTSGPKDPVMIGGEKFSGSQVPAKGSVEYQVQMLTVEQWKGHDELFRKHPLFKQDFLWGQQKDPKKRKHVQGIIDRCWGEVVKLREEKDRIEEEEKIKKMKMGEEDEDYQGKGKKGGNRGRKRKK